MPPVTMVSNREEDSMNTELSMSGKAIIGLIYPPPDIRTIVDKTAAFVARNGVDFENKIREKEANNKRFNFLSPTDPYNAYYKQKVRDFQEGKVDSTPTVPKPQLPEAVKDAVKRPISYLQSHRLLSNSVPIRPQSTPMTLISFV